MKNSKQYIMFIAAVAALQFGGLAAFAQAPAYQSDSDSMSKPRSTATSSDNASLKHGDKSFIERAAKMNAEEVDVSRIVSQNGSDPQVREFASEMVSAHEKVATDLAALAARKGVTLKDESESTKKWTDKKSNEIDEDYVKKMKSAHKSLIELFEKAAKSDDAEIAAFASGLLPDLRNHYSKVDSLKSQVKS